MRGLLATFVLGLALAIAGCGTEDRAVLNVAFVSGDSEELESRTGDMLTAAQLASEVVRSAEHEFRITEASRTENVRSESGPFAWILAPAERISFAPDEISLSLTPGGAGIRTGGTGVNIWMVPALSLSNRARRQYLASGLPRSSGVFLDDPFVPGTPSGTYITPALSQDNYPPAGRAFFKRFEEENGRAPDRFAIYAYEAVSLLADAVTRVEDSGLSVTTERVARELKQIRDRFGPIGHYDVLADGSITSYVFQARGEPAPPENASLIEVRR